MRLHSATRVRLLAAVSLAISGCVWPLARGPKPIDPGPGASERIRVALIEARAGDVIALGAGRFEFDAPVVVDGAGVTLRGQGIHETTLDFSGVATGSGDGIHVTGSQVVLEDLSVEATPGDGIRLQKARELMIRRIRVAWPGLPRSQSGAYGLYPVECQDVVIEDSVVQGASDAGIYVGQSQRVLVRRNHVFESVSGLQIENSMDVEVRENHFHDNTVGLMAFALPDLPVKSMRRLRVADNQVWRNNLRNFAEPGSLVSQLSPGLGILLVATDDVEVTGNRIGRNQTSNLSIYSYGILQRPYRDAQYDPFPERVSVHGNQFEPGGGDPQGSLAAALEPYVGRPRPDIFYDSSGRQGTTSNEKSSSERRLSLRDNGDADFIELDLERFFRGDVRPVSRDASRYSGPPFAPIVPAPPRNLNAN